MKQFTLSKLALLLLPLSAGAQIVQYDFTDTGSAAKTVTATSTSYLNAKGQIKISALAGLDRKIQLTIKNSSGTVTFDQTSTLVTVTDRLTDKDGTGFYGKQFTVPTLTEGKYTITSKVMDINNAIISTNSYVFYVDKTAPAVGDFTWLMNYGAGTAPDGLPRFSTVEGRAITLNGVTDALVGVDNVKFDTYWLDGEKAGTKYASGSVAYDATNQTAQLGTGGMSTVTAAHFPSGVQNKIKMTYTVTDKAGNATSKDLTFYDNSKCSEAPTLVAIQDPTYVGAYLGKPVFTGFKEVPSGGSTPVKINPVKAVYRWALDQMRWTDEGAIYGGYPLGSNTGVVYKDANYAYTIVSGTIVTQGYYVYPDMGWVNGSTWRCGKLLVPNADFSDEANPPRILSAQAYVEGVGWVANGYNGLSPNAPFDTKVTHMKVTVEPRIYAQSISGYGSCTVPAGGTSCTADVDVDYKKTGTIGVANPVVKATNPTTGAYDSYVVLLWEYDAQVPVFDSLISHDTTTKLVQFSAIEYNAGSIWNRVRMKSGGLIATNKKTGVVTTITASNMQTNGTSTIFTVDYGSLPDGAYSVQAWFIDNYDNKVTKDLFDTTADSSAPTITFSGMTAGSITKIDNLLVKVTDAVDNDPILTSVSLKGGPIDDSLTLGFSKQSDGYYHLESPRMFPSLDDTQKYTISVSARDAQGNTASANTTFLLTPENLVALGTIKGLAVNKNLLDSSNTPLTYAKITTVKTSAGATATGAQHAYFTLRRDAAFAVVVNNVTVQPGETKAFTLTLDNTGGAVLPIYPAVNGSTGDAAFMVDIPQLVAN